jgi:glycosyltransferase involved in cell wall biosynthesis
LHIAVIIPAFNVAPYLRDAITSVLHQTHPDWTMVIVDDGSTDATPGIAGQFADRRINLVRQDNAGVSAARNRGIAASTSAVCLFLDADDWLAPNALARLAAALDAAPAAPAASAACAHVSPGGSVHLAPPPPHGALLRRLLVRNLFANGGHLLVRRAAIEAAGPFRTDLRYGEDWEYWTRLALLGPFAASPGHDPVLFVRERPGSAYLSMATDPACFAPALNAIYANPAIAHRLGMRCLSRARRRAEAENAWIIGRELIRHDRLPEGLRWLARSLRAAPTLKRIGLASLSWTRAGPFRPYKAT